jgi:glycosyltransferase involved in cell wall biosynthesis
MNEPFFSVVMPTFNRFNKISQTIESVLNQTFKNYEFIIVDDGSTDQTEEVINRYRPKDPRIKYIKTKNWGGPARPRNIGIEASKGSYISFLDDDDIWYKNKLEVVNKYIYENPEYILFCHNEDYYYNGIKKCENDYGPYDGNLYETLLFKNNKVSTSAATVKKETLIDSGCFSEDRSIISVEDYDLWIRLSVKGKFFHIPEILGQYIVESDGDNISCSLLKHSEAYLSVGLKNLAVWGEAYPNNDKVINKRISDLYFNAAMIVANAGWKNIFHYIIASIKIHPYNPKPYLIIPALIEKKIKDRKHHY